MAPKIVVLAKDIDAKLHRVNVAVNGDGVETQKSIVVSESISYTVTHHMSSTIVPDIIYSYLQFTTPPRPPANNLQDI